MIVAPGKPSSRTPSVQPREDQLFYLIKGEIEAQVGDERRASNEVRRRRPV